MRSLKFIGLVTLLIISSLRLGHSQSFSLEYSDSNRNLIIQNDQVTIKSNWIDPSMYPAVNKGEWKHISRSEDYDELSGLPGLRTTDVFKNNDIEIERQVWISSDKKVVAMRQKLSNFRKKPLNLQSMHPIACNSAEAFVLKGNTDLENWNINAQKRRKNEFPEVESAFRISHDREMYFRHKENVIKETNIYFADSNMAAIFTLNLLQGDPSTALIQPNSIIITKEMSEKYFAGEDPINKSLVTNDETEYNVTGVAAPYPSNSHFKFNFLASMSTIKSTLSPYWLGNQVYTYVLSSHTT